MSTNRICNVRQWFDPPSAGHSLRARRVCSWLTADIEGENFTDRFELGKKSSSFRAGLGLADHRKLIMGAGRASIALLLMALACSATAAPWFSAHSRIELGSGALQPLAGCGEATVGAARIDPVMMGVQVGGSLRAVPPAPFREYNPASLVEYYRCSAAPEHLCACSSAGAVAAALRAQTARADPWLSWR